VGRALGALATTMLAAGAEPATSAQPWLTRRRLARSLQAIGSHDKPVADVRVGAVSPSQAESIPRAVCASEEGQWTRLCSAIWNAVRRDVLAAAAG
jgi:hypothetical protein